MSTAIAAASPAAPTSVEDVCSFIQSTQAKDAALLCDFARLFFAKVPRQLLQERDPEMLAAMTLGAFRFLQRSRPEEVNVEVTSPASEGWDVPVTVIRAEVGDRPFIVDSIREYLSAENIAIQHYIYPVLRVRRDAQGNLLAVSAPRDRHRAYAVGAEPESKLAQDQPEAEHATLEALIHCEISPVPDEQRCNEIRREVERRLGDVVAATTDFARMVDAADDTLALVGRYAVQFPERAEEMQEIVNFLRWLRHDNFVFLGYREYSITGTGDEAMLTVQPHSGLGILREETESRYAAGVPITELSEALRRRVMGGPVLIISKTNAESTVHRRARMDYVGIKLLGDDGQIVGERRFLGLFTSKAYSEHAETIPILRHKLERVLDASGAPTGSHDYKEIITIFNSMPKEEVFRASPAELEQEIQTVLSLLFTDEIRVSLRPDPLGRGISAMVILPRGKFSGEVRRRIESMLAQRLGGQTLNYHLAMGAGDQARLHFYFSAPAQALEAIHPRAVEQEVRQIIRSWEERLRDELLRAFGSVEGQRLAALYGPAFSDEYRAVTPPALAVADVAEMERMRREDQDVAIRLRVPEEHADEHLPVSILQLYLRDERLILSDFMPILENAGVRVVDVNPAAVAGPGLPHTMIYSFAVQAPGGGPLPPEHAAILAEAMLAVRRGDAPNDGFNALILLAGLRWREVDVLRTYAQYAFQIGAVPTRDSSIRALTRYPQVARLIVQIFRARFDPGLQGSEVRGQGTGAGEHAVGENGGDSGEAASLEQLRARLARAIEAVSALADDRALRRICSLVDATVRTNYFRYGGAEPTSRSGGAPYISIKIRCADMEELRKCRLLYEIYVHSANMEGIHLRGSPVSRGGIRWSDRPDDFRTEIFGLVTTQIVKNAVIVPGGSKGGFVTNRIHADRDRMGKEAAEQYRTLIRGMLDITDNLVDGDVVPPPDVVRYDGDDPYLVVAADKGTAHLSDVANALAAEYNFWLGDAFASGGSNGYDHKEVGITARGGWECVKRHFHEMGKDIQEEPFTVAGIGDMSGDVFGNGMLLSRQIRLVAAFDHRHVFLDPDPDPATSYRERERLFNLPRSSWEDYDAALLSPGGMVVPRSSKGVELSEPVRRALGLEDDVQRLDGEALIRAVLRAPVELLWNGGIGTYVKDVEETHSEAGDSSNDPVRVNAQELRCQVVGEGGNLGFTQPARIAYALAGGRINTDALDNSAGVDMSDHEVNLKILLNAVVTSGEMTLDERNQLLEAMTGEVSTLVLADNFSQSLAVSLDEIRSRRALDTFAALITAFERERLLERGAEGLPTTDEIRDRAAEGTGLTRPTLCVLLAFAKLGAKSALLDSPLPDDAATDAYLRGYFPPAAVEAAGPERLHRHRLHREIVATTLVNDLVDLMGAAFLHQVSRDTGRTIPDVARGWLIASSIAGAPEIRADLARLESRVPADTVYRWLFGLARVLELTTHWALANVAADAATGHVIEELRDGLAELRGDFAAVVTGSDRDVFLARVAELEQLGVDPTLARRLITLRFLPQLLNILRIAREADSTPSETARAYYLVAEHFACTRLRQAVRDAAGDTHWDKRFAQALVEDIDRAQRRIARAILRCSQGGQDTDQCLEEFDRRHAREILDYWPVIDELRAAEGAPLSAHAVAVRALQGIATG